MSGWTCHFRPGPRCRQFYSHQATGFESLGRCSSRCFSQFMENDKKGKEPAKLSQRVLPPVVNCTRPMADGFNSTQTLGHQVAAQRPLPLQVAAGSLQRSPVLGTMVGTARMVTCALIQRCHGDFARSLVYPKASVADRPRSMRRSTTFEAEVWNTQGSTPGILFGGQLGKTACGGSGTLAERKLSIWKPTKLRTKDWGVGGMF